MWCDVHVFVAQSGSVEPFEASPTALFAASFSKFPLLLPPQRLHWTPPPFVLLLPTAPPGNRLQGEFSGAGQRAREPRGVSVPHVPQAPRAVPSAAKVRVATAAARAVRDCGRFFFGAPRVISSCWGVVLLYTWRNTHHTRRNTHRSYHVRLPWLFWRCRR